MNQPVLAASVIIPTHRRPLDAARAVASLRQQDLDAGRFEIIVVDNEERPTPELERLADEGGPAVRHVHEPRLGLHHARHAGARASRAGLLLFTDDDATFSSGWVRSYVDAFDAHPAMMAAGGPVDPVWACAPPDWLKAYMVDRPCLGELSLMDQGGAFLLRNDGIFFGVNMAVRKEALARCGGFNPECFGDIWLGDGETGLQSKITQAGHLIGYVPAALVHHHIPAGRMTFDYFRRRHENQGRADAYTWLHNHADGRRGAATEYLRKAVADHAWRRPGRFAQETAGPAALREWLKRCRFHAYWRCMLRYVVDARYRQLVERNDWYTAADN